ncbi:MAG: PEP-CTERM sorting domain-containing protein [Thiobacillaceae bacterium]|jgi:hypothetical protein
MRTLLSIVVLSSLAMPALAIVGPGTVPEPETLSLLAIGVIGMLVALRKNKK